MQKHKHGGDIYSQSCLADYSANINPLGPPKSVRMVLKECAEKIQNYPDVGQRRLRQALADHEGIPKEMLIFGNGAAELIFALALGCRPKRALLAVPGFAEYEEALLAAGCEISYYERMQDAGYEIAEDYLEHIDENLDMLFLCNPNNPTGNLMSREWMLQIAERCRKKQVLMVVDECFNGLIDEPENYSLKAYLDQYPNLFILNAFTKLYAMPGLRLGYGMCSDGRILEQMQRVLQPWNVSIPAQEAGIAALDEKEYVERTRKLVREERTYLTEGLRQLSLKVWDGTANYIFFWGPCGLADRCRNQGFLIRDCSNYRGLGPGYYRIAVRRHEENQAFLKVLEKLLNLDGAEGIRHTSEKGGK